MDLPPFMLEPLDGHKNEDQNRTNHGNSPEILTCDVSFQYLQPSVVACFIIIVHTVACHLLHFCSVFF